MKNLNVILAFMASTAIMLTPVFVSYTSEVKPDVNSTFEVGSTPSPIATESPSQSPTPSPSVSSSPSVKYNVRPTNNPIDPENPTAGGNTGGNGSCPTINPNSPPPSKERCR